MLCGVVAELEPKQIYRFVYVTVADDDVFVVDRLRAACQNTVTKAVVTVLNQNALIFTVFRKLFGIYTLASLKHHRIVVNVEIAILDQHVVTDIYVYSVRAWRSDREVRCQDIAIQIFYMVTLVDMR